MTDVIVVVNSGSSSLKFALFPAGTHTSEPLVEGKVTGIGRQPNLTATVEYEAAAVTEPLHRMLGVFKKLGASTNFAAAGEVDVRIPLFADPTHYPQTPVGDVFRQVSAMLAANR